MGYTGAAAGHREKYRKDNRAISFMTADMHIHTKYSCDSHETMENHCLQALKGEVSILCFTDHVDNNPHDSGVGFYNADGFFRDLRTVQDKYGDRLTILGGMEFAEPHLYGASFEKLEKLPYDYIIASLHFWKDDLFPSEMLKQRIPADVCFETYWAEMENMVRFGGFDCVGHFDFPKRYYKELLYDRDRIAGIFNIMVKNGLTLEVNTSSLRRGLTTTMPDLELLRLYRQCGGRYAAVGSDAHVSADLGANAEEAKVLLQEAGLQEVIFEKRELIPLRNLTGVQTGGPLHLSKVRSSYG